MAMKSKKVRQRSSVVNPHVPLAQETPLPVPQRKPGRPRKSEHPSVPALVTHDEEGEQAHGTKVAKARHTFSKAMVDAEKLLMTRDQFDGGGTPSDAFTVTKESLQRRVTRRLNVLDRYLTDDKLLELMMMSGLKEIGIYEGIMMDKSLVLQGQPTVIIGNDDRQAINTLLPRILGELRRRGMVSPQGQPILVNP